MKLKLNEHSDDSIAIDDGCSSPLSFQLLIVIYQRLL